MVSFANEKLNDFGQLYSRYEAREPIAQQLLQGQHRYFIHLTFDPLTGEALPQRMSDWLDKNLQAFEGAELYDRLTCLIDYSADAIGNILITPRQMIQRVHEMTPVYLAQRLDSRSVQWLSRKPGNNLREKLSSNPHILASTRKMSLDTLENRLLKTFLTRVLRLLLDRQEAGLKLTESQEYLIDLIKKNLRQEDFVAIKTWQHMPPNNVLLQDKQYSKVWRAWQQLNCLEDNCKYQQAISIASGFGVFSELLKELSKLERCILLDQAWQFKTDELSVSSFFSDTEGSERVNVSILDLGHRAIKDSAVITPYSELLLSLTSEGSILIQRQTSSGERSNWRIEFQSVEGIVYIRLNSCMKDNTQENSWSRAMPENFHVWIKPLIDELLPGDRPLRFPEKRKTKMVDDFVSVIFDGASYKFQTKKTANSDGPYFFDSSGLDCSHSTSVSNDEVIFSTKELAQIADHGDSRRLAHFVERLAQQVQAELGMHYLVSDHYSDFETNDLRHEMNRNFRNANPLPRSIAAVYNLLDKNQFKHNDLIMVLSSDGSGIYATPIYYCLDKTLNEEYLERHPSIKLSQQGEQRLLQRALVASGLPENIAKRFIELYSYSEIISGKAQLILHDDNHWYRVPAGLKVETVSLEGRLLKEAYALQKRKDKVYFLSVSPAIKQQKGIRPTQWLASDPLSGSQGLLKKQYADPHKTFWKDHLPQLMTRLPIEGIEQNFYFVDSRTSVKPERGVAVNIPIDTPFTLPSGKEEIYFTVYQGVDSHQQEFSLMLSLRQPLKKNCICKLTLTYTYGDEQPYKLRFSPIGEVKPFNYVDAQWGRKLVNINNRVMAIPAFPKKIAFDQLYAYSGKDRSIDIIDWLERNFNQMDEIYNFIVYGRNNRRFNFKYDDIEWIPEKGFGFYNSHPDYKSIFVHKSEFNSVDTINVSAFSGDVIIQGADRFALKNITVQGELSEYERNNLLKSWRFPMLIFSDQGRSFQDEDIPTRFSEKGLAAIEKAQRLLQELKCGDNKELESELKMFLVYCHKLIPIPIANKLLAAVTDKKVLRQENGWFKYSLGDCSQPWQKQLLEVILNPNDDTGGTRATTLEIISVAMWRDPTLIHQLTAEQIIAIAHRLNEYLQQEIKQLKSTDKFFKWNSFIIRLELLLALLRTRESVDPVIRSIFALDSDLSQQLLTTIEQVTDKQGEALADQLQKPRVVARVKLKVNKPAAYYRTPELLYALKLYLSGDDGADQITITELVNNA